MNYEQKVQKIVDYIKSGETLKKDFKLGVEMEHFIVRNEDYQSVSYFSKPAVSDILEKLKERGFCAHSEKGHILSLNRGVYDIATEPAAQFEIALKSDYSINKLYEDYKLIVNEINDILEKSDLSLLTMGYHPNMKIDDIEILPKDRYKHMYNYFKDNGGYLAHNMMKGTASLQVTVDFENEEDFTKKYFVANALSPFIYSVFDNAPIFEKKPYDKYNLRQTIWKNCDISRCDVFKGAFSKDLSYRKYAENLLKIPVIFVHKDGEDIPTGQMTIEEYMDYDSSDEFIFHALSIVFFDVRVKKYIEIRMADSVNYPLNFSLIAFIKGIFYFKQNLEFARDFFKNMNTDILENLKSRCIKRGIFAEYENQNIRDIMLLLAKKAKEALDDDEKQYIDFLIEMLNSNKTPRMIFEDMAKKDFAGAILNNKVKKLI